MTAVLTEQEALAARVYDAAADAETLTLSECAACRASCTSWCEDCQASQARAEALRLLHDEILAAPGMDEALAVLTSAVADGSLNPGDLPGVTAGGAR